MRGLLVLSNRRPEISLSQTQRQNFTILHENAAEYGHPPLFLSRAQLQFSRLRRRCDWVCVLAEGDCAAHGLILAAQLSVDRLILADALLQGRCADRHMRRLNAFARRNLALITAEIIAAGMGERGLKALAAGLGVCCGGLIHLPDAAELWQSCETFLTLPFAALSEPAEHAK